MPGLRSDSRYLEFLRDAVVEFRTAFEDYVEMHARNELGNGLLPFLIPKPITDSREIARKERHIGRLSGRAAAAPAITGVYVYVQGVGKVDPIANWDTPARIKPVLAPEDVLGACDRIEGILEIKMQNASVSSTLFLVEAMHPTVATAARPRWSDGLFEDAVRVASIALFESLCAKTGGQRERDELPLVQKWLSAAPPKGDSPVRLQWPEGGDDPHLVKNMRQGIPELAAGAWRTIRNPVAHRIDNLPEQAALERLAVLSLLAKMIDQCEQVEFPPPPLPAMPLPKFGYRTEDP